MLEKDTLIRVRNRDNGKVGYTIPDLGNLHRQFNPCGTDWGERCLRQLRKRRDRGRAFDSFLSRRFPQFLL